MARAQRRHKKKPSRRMYRKKYKVSVGKLLDKKVNTALERRMVEISKAEIDKSRVMLVRRQYIFGDETFGGFNQQFSTGRWQTGSDVTWSGSVIEMSNIAKTDVATTINNPPADDPETNMDEQKQDALDDGPNQLMTVASHHGERESDSVKLTGFSVALRVTVRQSEITLQESDRINLYDSVTVKWAIVSVQHDEIGTVGWEPTADRVLPLPRFGYDPKLDTDEAQKTGNFKYKTLFKGKIILNKSENRPDIKIVEKHIKLKNPLLLQYSSRDQTGQRPLKRKIFFVIRSTIPSPEGEEDVQFDEYYPTITGCLRTRYYEP